MGEGRPLRRRRHRRSLHLPSEGPFVATFLFPPSKIVMAHWDPRVSPYNASFFLTSETDQPKPLQKMQPRMPHRSKQRPRRILPKNIKNPHPFNQDVHESAGAWTAEASRRLRLAATTTSETTAADGDLGNNSGSGDGGVRQRRPSTAAAVDGDSISTTTLAERERGRGTRGTHMKSKNLCP
uniref:Uncharacterized protein n=1 Tax=Oryza barthii TaxID=65489 RepID=A0A0D3EJ27_9ORYZ